VVRMGSADEPRRVARGGALALEPLLLLAGDDATETLQRYVEGVALRTSALRDTGVVEPTGWWSWNAFFDEITEQRVLDHAALLRDKLRDRGFTLLEIDDGYEVRWGDWEETNPQRFPAGLAPVVQQVRALGLGVGLWLAPFLVDEQSPIATAHPQWFVRDSQDRPLRHTQLGVPRPCLVLDPTHPEAADHLRSLVGRLRAAGVTLLKLDFLYAAALPGRRHREEVTGTEALRLGLRLIHDAAPDAHLNLCGMPVLPAVGRGHSLRTGADIAFKGTTQGLGQLAHAARNVMTRAALDPLIRNDPDQVLVRAPLTVDEARVAATLAALTGFYAAGDDLTTLPSDRLEILTRPELLAIARAGRSALPRELLAEASDQVHASPLVDLGIYTNEPRTAAPTRFHLHGAEADHLALFNWSSEPRSMEVDLATLGLAGARVREIWEGRALAGPRVTLTLRPHSTALLEIIP